MWEPLLGVASEIWPKEWVEPEKKLCAGMSTAGNAIYHVARSTEEKTGHDQAATLPLYILNYIWDGDELSDADLKEARCETAQFSIHVIGVVFDGQSRSALLCDPNGALVQGGSMEFLTVPLRELRASVSHSTSNSRYDRYQAAKRKVAEVAAVATATAAAPKRPKTGK